MKWFFIIVVAIILVLLLWLISAYNSFIRLRNKVQEAFSTMDVFLKKRYDLIPNLVETVKGYAKHESGTLEKVIAARNQAASATTADERIEKDNILQGTLRTLFAVAEAYPELKANVNFMDLQRQLRDIEDEIEKSRRFYNGITNQYNTSIEMFPGNLIAGLYHFERKPLYEVNDEAQRENVKVQF